MISSDADFKKPELTYNLTTTKFQLPMEKLETGKMYYVGVSLVDNGKYVSSPAGPIILETPVPTKDMIGENKFNLQSAHISNFKRQCTERILNNNATPFSDTFVGSNFRI